MEINFVKRKKTRKLLYQQLFSQCFNNLNDADFQESFVNFDVDQKYLNEMHGIIFKYEKVFVQIIEKYSNKFRISSLNMSTILPIYIALWEMLYYSEEMPALVSINEAVVMAKFYWDEPIKKFVNWILAQVLANIDEIEKEKEVFSENDNIFSIFKK